MVRARGVSVESATGGPGRYCALATRGSVIHPGSPLSPRDRPPLDKSAGLGKAPNCRQAARVTAM
jgi:hypothetical protein